MAERALGRTRLARCGKPRVVVLDAPVRRRAICTLVVLGCLLPCLTPAQAIPAQPSNNAQTLAEAARQRFPQPVRVGDLLQRTVLQPLESQPKLGRVHQVVQKPDGTIAIVMEYGGVLGFFTRRIAVPVDGMTLLGQYMEVVAFTPEELDRFATFDGGGVPLSDDAVIKVGLAKPSH